MLPHTGVLPLQPPCMSLLTVPEEDREEDREEGEGLRGTGVPKGNILNTEPIQCLLKEDRPS